MVTIENLTSYKADPNTANPTTFVWDFDNRLANADTDGDGTADVTFRYDALGRRVRKTTSSSDTVFALAGQQVIAEYTSGAAPNAPNERYVYASYVDEPILKDGTLATGTGIVYYTRNQQYSITALTDSSGSVVERYAYTDHGKTTLFDGTGAAITASAYANPYTYTARRFDRETNLLYFRARMYSPHLGRFLSRDPLGFVDGMSLYRAYFAQYGLDPFGFEHAPDVGDDDFGLQDCVSNSIRRDFGLPDALERFMALIGLPRASVDGRFYARRKDCKRCCGDGTWKPAVSGSVGASLYVKGVTGDKDLRWVKFQYGLSNSRRL